MTSASAVEVAAPDASIRDDQDGEWLDVGPVGSVPLRGARVLRTPRGDVALFRTASDACFALRDRCPHNGGPLSQGIVHGEHVTCPLHNWVVGLADGEAQGADHGCTPSIALRVEAGRILLGLASMRAALAS